MGYEKRFLSPQKIWVWVPRVLGYRWRGELVIHHLDTIYGCCSGAGALHAILYTPHLSSWALERPPSPPPGGRRTVGSQMGARSPYFTRVNCIIVYHQRNFS